MKWHFSSVEALLSSKFWKSEKKWPYLLNWVEYCGEILHTHWYWQDVAQEIVKCHLGLVEVLPRFKFWKQWNFTLKPFKYFDKILQTLILTRSSLRNCKMTFIIGRGFAERQIQKKWKWPYLLNWVEYFDKVLRKHWYWQDLAQEIAKWHFSSVEALPSSKFWKSDNGAISWTEWNIVMKFCILIDIDKMYPMRLSNDIWNWLSFCQGSDSEKCETIAKWHLSSVEALPSAKFWKNENGLISWTEWNILIDFCINIDIDKI